MKRAELVALLLRHYRLGLRRRATRQVALRACADGARSVARRRVKGICAEPSVRLGEAVEVVVLDGESLVRVRVWERARVRFRFR